MTDTTANATHFETHGAHAAHDAEHKPGFFVRWFMSTNHKDIGTLYLIFAIVAGIIGGTISGLMRWGVAEPGIQPPQAGGGARKTMEEGPPPLNGPLPPPRPPLGFF